MLTRAERIKSKVKGALQKRVERSTQVKARKQDRLSEYIAFLLDFLLPFFFFDPPFLDPFFFPMAWIPQSEVQVRYHSAN